MVDSLAERPPAEVMPALARALGRSGYVPIGVLRSALFEVAGREDGTEEFLVDALRSTQVITRYLDGQMAAGRLRRMDPFLAMQAFLAPIMFHVVSRPLLDEYGLTAVSVDEAVQDFTESWLRAMAPPRHRRAERCR